MKLRERLTSWGLRAFVHVVRLAVRLNAWDEARYARDLAACDCEGCAAARILLRGDSHGRHGR